MEFSYGSVLKIQREFGSEDIFKALKNMKELGMNTVVIWPAIYWWEDRNLPHYPFNTGREILRQAEELDMRVIMELEGQVTFLEYAPDFLMKNEYYPVDIDGHKLNKGNNYGFLNYNHPEVKQLMHKMFSEAAENYKDYKSLYGYDIYNETRFESFDEYTLQLFREWLKQKYKKIERLNDIWEKVHYDWSQIQFSNWMWASVMPVVDYNQFKKETMNMLLKEWYKVVKEIDPNHVIIADNVYSTVSKDEHYSLPQDDWGVAESVDEFGISLYPKNDAVGLLPYERWHTLAGIHSASKTGNFWISELQSHNVAMFNPFSVVHHYNLRWWNWEAISHGAKGIIYWKWDPFIKGVQTLGRGLVDNQGKYTIRAKEAGAIGKVLSENKKEFCTYQPELPKVAILYDKLNHDFNKAYSKNHGQKLSDTIYLDSLAGLYDCLWQNNIPANYVIPRDIIDGSINAFKVLFITSQVNISDEFAEALKKYVHQGGTVICDGRFGVVDDYGIVQYHMPGGNFNSIMGYSFQDIDPDDLKINVQLDEKSSIVMDGYYEKQLLNVNDSKVQVLGRFDDGYPAILKTPYGCGSIIYVATFLWYGYHMEKYEGVNNFIKALSLEYSLSLHSITNNELKISTLKGDDGSILFVFNYNGDKKVADVTLSNISSEKCNIKNLYTGEEMTVNSQDSKLIINVAVEGKDVSIYKVSF